MRRRTMNPPNEMRVLIGLALQPFVAAAVAAIASPFFLLDGDGQTLAGGAPANPVGAAVSIGIGSGVVALFVAVVLGFPAALWLTRGRGISLFGALAVGIALGNVPFVVGVLLAGTYGITGFIRGAGLSSLLGMAGAAVFWRVAMREAVADTKNLVEL